MPEYRYQIESDTANIGPLIKELLTKWEGYHLSERMAFHLRLALEEAIVNAIKHGNSSRPELKVTVLCRAEPDRIELEVSDQGPGFDYRNLPDPTLTQNLTKYGGRGLFLIKEFMDKLEFLDGGKKMKMTKIIPDNRPRQIAELKEGKMKLLTNVIGEVTVCKIEGEIDIDNSYRLRQAFEEITKQDSKKVIVDFSALNYIDSSGLATLIEMLQRLKKIGGSLRICALNEKVKSVFEITKLDTLFGVYENLAAAQEDF